MNDIVSPMHEFSTELDRMTREGPAGEDASADAITGLQADAGASGAYQLAHREHAGRPGANHDDIGTNRRPARMTHHAPFGDSWPTERADMNYRRPGRTRSSPFCLGSPPSSL